jgi:UPF0755 protein
MIQNPSTSYLLKLAGFFILVLIAMTMVAAFVPKQFPVGTIVRINKNTDISTVASRLYEKHVIASPLLFKVAVAFFHGQKGIVAGDYAFDKPQNLWTVVGRLSRGDQGLTPIKVLIPEGATVEDVAWLLLKKIPEFDSAYFVKIAHDYEGYLFPDTYFFYENTTADEAFAALRSNFNKKFQTLTFDVAVSRRSPRDIVTMASIIEREGKTIEDRATIAGILWKRLDEGMPLQVDATLVYVTDDNYVSLKDTKLDSPYNTYKNKGLPPTPISNPGIDALRAAAQPVKTPYYYYLSDSDGNIHYATTFEGHQINREKYLRK